MLHALHSTQATIITGKFDTKVAQNAFLYVLNMYTYLKCLMKVVLFQKVIYFLPSKTLKRMKNVLFLALFSSIDF